MGRAVVGPVSAGTAEVNGRLEAASVAVTGALTAATLAVAGTASVSGHSSAQTLAGEMLTASGTARADRISSTGLHGPDASIGSLSVGSCGRMLSMWASRLGGLSQGPNLALNRRHCLGRSLRLSRGLSLFGSLLALGLLGAMVLAAALFFENRAMDERARLAARQLTVLSDAAASYVSGRFPAMLTALGGGSSELTLAALRGAGALPAGFADMGAMGRGYRVLMLAAGADTIDLLVTQTVPAGRRTPGSIEVPASALFGAGGNARMGVVLPDIPDRLTGPAVDADIGAFQAAFGGAPEAGALATLRRLDHRAVYGDQL